MNGQDKALLVRNVCARLPYDLYVEYEGQKYLVESVNRYDEIQLEGCNFTIPIYEAKPYLRPISSMTEEEFNSLKRYSGLEYDQLELSEWKNNYKTLEFWLKEIPSYVVITVFDWLNAHQFDYCDLIQKGLAIEFFK